MVRMAASLAAALLLAAPALAQQHGGSDNMGPSGQPQPAADTKIMETMQNMNRAMSSLPMSGNPDHDFAIMMIPHHQGAIDMAQFELDNGKDASLRALAQRIIADQKKEIDEMTQWLKSHQPTPTP